MPLSIQAITDETIDNLDISRFEDVANLSPSISYISAGPGSTFMFIRGIADGSNPNRPIRQLQRCIWMMPPYYSGGIADLHNYDIERIEVLNGPQGTYYGASATSGTVRIITKKPDPEGFDAGADLSFGSISGGDGVSTVEGFVNIPVQPGVSAIRLVAWYDKSDGFVDNVSTTRTYLNGATVSNDKFSKAAYNEEKTTGFRGSFKTPIGEKWSGLISGFVQNSETSGAWDHDPTRYDDLEVARFGPEFSDLSYGQVAWSLQGDLGFADIIYSGYFLDRDTKQTSDYSDYVEYASFGAWVQQFACDDYYWYGNINCNDPSMFFEGDYQSEQTTHEVRINSTGEGPLSWMLVRTSKITKTTISFLGYAGIPLDSGPGAYYILLGGEPLPNEWWSADWESE